MLVTPLRDGMNLVCKEYVAARHRGGGVLVLSEFAGAAGELRQALLVNPHDVVGMRETIARAISLPEGEARRRMRELRRQVRTHDVHRFARTFLEALAEARRVSAVRPTATMKALEQALARLAREPHLLVACDYDGTLAPIVDVPGDARPRRESVAALRALAALADTSVAVISGRSLHDLAALSRLPEEIHLVGSHGTEFDVGFARALAPEALALRDRVTDELHAIAATRPGRDWSSTSRPARRCTTGRPPRRTAPQRSRPCARARRCCPACTRARASR